LGSQSNKTFLKQKMALSQRLSIMIILIVLELVQKQINDLLPKEFTIQGYTQTTKPI
jgi:hypothetical protein